MEYHQNTDRSASCEDQDLRQDEIRRKMASEATPSTSGIHTKVSGDTNQPSEDDSDSILIETDGDSDSVIVKTDSGTDSDGGCMDGTQKPTVTHNTVNSGRQFSSAPQPTFLAKKMMSITKKSRRRQKYRVQRKRVKTLLLRKRGSTASRKDRHTAGQQSDNSDSDWESVSESTVSNTDTADDDDDNNTLGEDSEVMLEEERQLVMDIDQVSQDVDETLIPGREELEKTIADGSVKNNLSVSNVKSIIRALLTHDLVKEMLKSRLSAAEEDAEEGETCEPKLTRSKMKEVLEKGKDPRLWPMSPVKLGQPTSTGPSILDMEFTDDEDEEYEPSKDIEGLESDDESVTSSRVSDIGSPFTHSSPRVKQPPSTPSTPKGPTPFSPSTSTPVLLHSMPAFTAPKSPGKGADQSAVSQAEEDGIARRTRSKLPLTTTSLYDIEEAFVAPDITPDMYDTMCDDTDWQEFLQSLHKFGATDTHESIDIGEEDDPEFNYTAEAEGLELDVEEVRFDGPFRVSRKELHSLLEELEDLFNEDDYSMIGLRTNLASAHHNAALLAKKPTSSADLERQQYCASEALPSSAAPPATPAPATLTATSPPSKSTPVPVDVPLVLSRQLRVIEEQMRKHVQLTTQMFVLAQGSGDFQTVAEECRKMVVELDRLRTVSTAGPRSAYNMCNLAGAVNIVNGDVHWASHRRSVSKETEKSSSTSDKTSVSELPVFSVSVSSESPSVSSMSSVGTPLVSSWSVNVASAPVPLTASTPVSSVSASVSSVFNTPARSVSSVCSVPVSSVSSTPVSSVLASVSSVLNTPVNPAAGSGTRGQGVSLGLVDGGGRKRKRSSIRSHLKGANSHLVSQAQPQTQTKVLNVADNRLRLLEKQKEVMWTSPVFLYPSLLPRLGLVPPDIARRVKSVWTEGEDALLVLGKDQFADHKLEDGKSKAYVMTHKYLMPCKTPTQLHKHFHRPRKGKGVIQQYKETGELPESPQEAEDFSADMVKAPCDQPDSLLPAWCWSYRGRHSRAATRESMEANSERHKEAVRKQKRVKTKKQRHLKPTRAVRQQMRETEGSCSDKGPDKTTKAASASEEQDSSCGPPEKCQRETFERCVQLSTEVDTSSENLLTILSSVPSTTRNSSAAIVTSKGIYIPLQLADLGKLKAALTGSHVVVVGETGDQQVLTMEQLSRQAGEVGDVTSLLPSLTRLCRNSATYSQQERGSGGQIECSNEQGIVNCEQLAGSSAEMCGSHQSEQLMDKGCSEQSCEQTRSEQTGAEQSRVQIHDECEQTERFEQLMNKGCSEQNCEQTHGEQTGTEQVHGESEQTERCEELMDKDCSEQSYEQTHGEQIGTEHSSVQIHGESERTDTEGRCEQTETPPNQPDFQRNPDAEMSTLTPETAASKDSDEESVQRSNQIQKRTRSIKKYKNCSAGERADTDEDLLCVLGQSESPTAVLDHGNSDTQVAEKMNRPQRDVADRTCQTKTDGLEMDIGSAGMTDTDFQPAKTDQYNEVCCSGKQTALEAATCSQSSGQICRSLSTEEQTASNKSDSQNLKKRKLSSDGSTLELVVSKLRRQDVGQSGEDSSQQHQSTNTLKQSLPSCLDEQAPGCMGTQRNGSRCTVPEDYCGFCSTHQDPGPSSTACGNFCSACVMEQLPESSDSTEEKHNGSKSLAEPTDECTPSSLSVCECKPLESDTVCHKPCSVGVFEQIPVCSDASEHHHVGSMNLAEDTPGCVQCSESVCECKPPEMGSGCHKLCAAGPFKQFPYSCTCSSADKSHDKSGNLVEHMPRYSLCQCCGGRCDCEPDSVLNHIAPAVGDVKEKQSVDSKPGSVHEQSLHEECGLERGCSTRQNSGVNQNHSELSEEQKCCESDAIRTVGGGENSCTASSENFAAAVHSPQPTNKFQQVYHVYHCSAPAWKMSSVSPIRENNTANPPPPSPSPSPPPSVSLLTSYSPSKCQQVYQVHDCSVPARKLPPIKENSLITPWSPSPTAALDASKQLSIIRASILQILGKPGKTPPQAVTSLEEDFFKFTKAWSKMPDMAEVNITVNMLYDAECTQTNTASGEEPAESPSSTTPDEGGEATAQGEATSQGEASGQGAAATQGEASRQGEAATQGEASRQGEAATQGEASRQGEAVTQGEVLTQGEASRQGEASSQGQPGSRGSVLLWAGEDSVSTTWDIGERSHQGSERSDPASGEGVSGGEEAQGGQSCSVSSSSLDSLSGVSFAHHSTAGDMGAQPLSSAGFTSFFEVSSSDSFHDNVALSHRDHATRQRDLVEEADGIETNLRQSVGPQATTSGEAVAGSSKASSDFSVDNTSAADSNRVLPSQSSGRIAGLFASLSDQPRDMEGSGDPDSQGFVLERSPDTNPQCEGLVLSDRAGADELVLSSSSSAVSVSLDHHTGVQQSQPGVSSHCYTADYEKEDAASQCAGSSDQKSRDSHTILSSHQSSMISLPSSEVNAAAGLQSLNDNAGAGECRMEAIGGAGLPSREGHASSGLSCLELETSVGASLPSTEVHADAGLSSSEVSTRGGIPSVEHNADAGLSSSEVRRIGIPSLELSADAGLSRSKVGARGGLPSSELSADAGVFSSADSVSETSYKRPRQVSAQPAEDVPVCHVQGAVGLGESEGGSERDGDLNRQRVMEKLMEPEESSHQLNSDQDRTEILIQSVALQHAPVTTAATLPLLPKGEDDRDLAQSSESGEPARVMSQMQAENERSPPAHRFEDMLMVPTHSSSESPALSSPPTPHDTPVMLSSLGLVSASQVQPGSSLYTGTGAAPVGEVNLPAVSSHHASPPSQVVAMLTPIFYTSPDKSPTTYALRCTQGTKSPPTSLPVLAPKPGPVTYPPAPFLPRKSPKKQQLQKQVRAILPKGYSYELKMTSPTKVAARTLKRKATLFCQRSPNKPLLPKDASYEQQSAQNRPMTRGQSNTLSSLTTSLPRWSQRGRNRPKRPHKKKDATAVAAATKVKPAMKGGEDGSQEESDETGSEMDDVAMTSQDDSQNEEEGGEMDEGGGYLHDLMAASTTIGFNPYIKSTPDKDGHCSKLEIRRQQKLSLLASDVVDTDPRKDERDLACAQLYINKVKVAMQKDPATYTKFMDLLRQFETNPVSPVQVYESVSSLLVNYPELLDDLSAFLHPSQALHSGCHVTNQLTQDVRAFLRKLEIHFGGKAELRYQKILRTMGKWDSRTKSAECLREMLMPLLRGLPQHLHDDFVGFFPELHPPETHMESEDFEDIRLPDSDEEGHRSPDDFEDITFPEENDPYRTRRCPCPCHREMFTTRKKKKEKYTHCYNCCLKVVDGVLYFQPSNVTTRRPVSATFFQPVPMPLPSDPPPQSAHSSVPPRHMASTVEVDEDDHDDDIDDDIEFDDEILGVKVVEEDKPEVVEEPVNIDDEAGSGDKREETNVEEEKSYQPSSPKIPKTDELPVQSTQPSSTSSQDTTSQLAQPVQRSSIVDVLQPLVGRPSSPLQPLPSLTALPPRASVLHKSQLMPSPGQSNFRMRKRMLGMRPRCQVFPPITSQIRPAQEHPSTCTETPSTPGTPGTSSTLLSPAWMPPRILPSQQGTVSVVGPDNTVIMFNSSLPSRPLGDSLPGLREGRNFFPPLAGEQVGAAGESGAKDMEMGKGSEVAALPTITSPCKNIQRGSFAGLLHKSQPAATGAVPEDRGKGDTDDSRQSAAPPPLMSEDTFNSLFKQMWEGGGQNNSSVSFDLPDCSSDDIPQMVQWPESDHRSGSPQGPLDRGPHTQPATAVHGASHVSPDCGGPHDAGLLTQMDVQDLEWSSDQDRLILQMLQDQGDSADTYSQIATILQQVTPQQVSERVQTLMDLLKYPEEDASDNDEG